MAVEHSPRICPNAGTADPLHFLSLLFFPTYQGPAYADYPVPVEADMHENQNGENDAADIVKEGDLVDWEDYMTHIKESQDPGEPGNSSEYTERP
jgi:hypothetical protein